MKTDKSENTLGNEAAWGPFWAVSVFLSAGKLSSSRFDVKKEDGFYGRIEKLPEALREREKADYRKVSKIGVKKEASICTNEFIDVMRHNPRADMANFCKLCSPNSIDYMLPFKNGQSTWYGAYLFWKNEIWVAYDEVRENIFHELMHRLSTRIFGTYIFSGFRQIKMEIQDDKMKVVSSIGEGIGEAYNQVLTERYFAEHGCAISYRMITDLAFFVECIIGYEKMEQFYFDSDLNSLIEEIAKYSSCEEAVTFIEMFDDFFRAIYKNSSLLSMFRAKKLYRNLIGEILRMNVRKMVGILEEVGIESLDVLSECQDSIDELLRLQKQFKFRYRLSESDWKDFERYAARELGKIGLSFSLDMDEYKTMKKVKFK